MPTIIYDLQLQLLFWCRASEFDKISSAPFELKTTDQQTAMNGTFTVATTMCNITYVTSTFDYQQLLIHTHNGYTSTRTIKQVSTCPLVYAIYVSKILFTIQKIWSVNNWWCMVYVNGIMCPWFAYNVTAVTYRMHLLHPLQHNLHTCLQVIVNGSDVTSSVVNKLSLVVPPMSSTMLTVPVNSSLGPGHLYTVVLVYAETGSVPSVAGGRLAKTHFPIESWPKSHECPYPTIMDDNYKV